MSTITLDRKTVVSFALLMLAGMLPGAALAAGGPNAFVPFLRTAAPQQPVAAIRAPAKRACAAADLQVATGAQGARKGFATQEVQLTNRGNEACYLTGTPDFFLGLKGAQAIARRPGAPAALRERTDLAPGDTALVLVGAPGACAAAIGPERKVTTHMQVKFPGGGSKALEGAYVDTLCGPATVVDMQVLHGAPAKGSPLALLQSAVHLDGRAMPGSELHYTVTLTNPTAKAIALTPCPSFTQSLFGDRELSAATLRLNCGATGNEIAAGKSIAYEMRLAIPAHVAADAVKLSWKLADGPTAGTTVALREVAR